MKWLMRDGTEIEISDMKTSHIINSLRMLKDKGYVSHEIVSFYIGCDRPNGEAANDAFDAEFNQVMNAPVTPYIKAFNDELESRGMSKDDIQKSLRYQHTPAVEMKKTRRFGYHLCPIHQQEYLQYCSCCVLELHAQKKRKRHGKKKKESIC